MSDTVDRDCGCASIFMNGPFMQPYSCAYYIYLTQCSCSPYPQLTIITTSFNKYSIFDIEPVSLVELTVSTSRRVECTHQSPFVLAEM